MRRKRHEPDVVLDAREAEEKQEQLNSLLDLMTAEELARHLLNVERYIGEALKAEKEEERRQAGKDTKDSQSKKPSTSPNKHATKSPSYAFRAEKFVRQHPGGVRTYEVSKAIGQSVQSAFKTLKLLEQQGRVVRHGARNQTLWTMPNDEPRFRVDTIDLAVLKVLRDAGDVALDGAALVETVKGMVNQAQKRMPRTDSITSALYRLVAGDYIAKGPSNEHGPTYKLGEKAKKGGSTTSESLN